MRDADPRVKLFWTIICTTGAIIFNRPCWMLGLSIFTLVGAIVLGNDMKTFIARFKGFLPLLLMVALVQIIFVRSGEPLLLYKDITLISKVGLIRGLGTAMRFFVILCSSSVMAAENKRRFIVALTNTGVPYLFSFLLMTALRFLPFFSSSFEDALVAIQLRGIQPKTIPWQKRLRLYGSLVLPVVADAIVKAQNLAMAMEARGFGALTRRTSYIKVRMTAKDWLLLVGLIVLSAWVVLEYYFI